MVLLRCLQHKQSLNLLVKNTKGKPFKTILSLLLDPHLSVLRIAGLYGDEPTIIPSGNQCINEIYRPWSSFAVTIDGGKHPQILRCDIYIASFVSPIESKPCSKNRSNACTDHYTCNLLSKSFWTAANNETVWHWSLSKNV